MSDLSLAKEWDSQDPLAPMREKFWIPQTIPGTPDSYFCGNSLGLQPKLASQYVQEELEKWKTLGVKGHFAKEYPWFSYHEFLSETAAKLVGAKPSEVVVMNSLTVNLHLMMVSFYRPTPKRFKILIEEHAFPSDIYAVTSQLAFHGWDPREGILTLKSQTSTFLKTSDWLEILEREGDSIALVLLPGVQYLTGQVTHMETITRAAHAKGCMVGIDLAHAAGNIPLQLHEWEVDFAVWCHYKYLNSGPGALAGCFVHENHMTRTDLPRFAGWWGQDKSRRFLMESTFSPIPTAEGWQLSNPPIFSMAAIRASYDTFEQAGGMEPLRKKSLKLTGFLEELLQKELPSQIQIMTPQDPRQRGAQLSLKLMRGHGRNIVDSLESRGVIADWREPDIIRVSPVPLYNTFMDVWNFVHSLKQELGYDT